MTDSLWLDLERELNPMQREAVFSDAAHNLVLAGPGTGKTRTLVNRIVYLVTVAGVAPEAILALTFTRKAATVMVDRLAGYLGERSTAIRAGTFHHFGLELLRHHAKLPELPADFAVADEGRQLACLRRAWNRLGISSREAEDKELRLLLGRFGGARLASAEGTGDAGLSDLQQDLFAEYQRLLREEGALDFDDILWLSHRALASDAALLAATRQRWPQVLVDEFQDTDTLQYLLFRQLVPVAGRSFLVADDEQSIYGWRGADRANIGRYREDYAPREIHLEENYRNRSAILRAAQAMLAAGGEASRDLVSRAGGRGSLRLESFPSEAEEAAFLAADIRSARLRDPSLRWRDIALLYPKHSIGEFLETHLMEERVPVELVASRALLEQERIRKLMALLRLLRNGNDEDALGILLEDQLDEGSFSLLRAVARRQDGSLRGAMNRLLRARGRLGGLRRRWESFARAHPQLPEEDWLAAVTREFPQGLGLDEFLAVAADETGPPTRQALLAAGERLGLLSRLPWLLEGLVARIGNLRAGRGGRTLSQLVREILLELDASESESLPGDPAEIEGLAELLERLREALRRGRRVWLEASTPQVARLLAQLFHRGLEPWQARHLVPVDETRPARNEQAGELTLHVDGADQALRLEGEDLLVVAGAPAPLLLFRLYQLLLSAEHRPLQDFVIFDLETTGVDTRRCEIVEIAAIRYEAGREVERFASLVRPVGPIPAEATRVHGIDDGAVADAPPLSQVLPRFLAFVGARDLVAHNGANFDFPLLRRFARELGLPRPANALFDTLAMARQLFPGERSRLEDLIGRFHIRAEARHRALDDCRCLGEAFTRMQALRLAQLRRRTGKEALAPAALALHLDRAVQARPAVLTAADRILFREGVRRLMGSGNAWLDEIAAGPERKQLEVEILEAAGLTGEAPELFTGLRSEEERFLGLVPRFDELFLGDSLASFLDFMALYQAPDYAGGLDAVQLMTIHSAKGLEFRRVYVIGLEENVLPGYYSLRGRDEASLAEERRLLYVAMTRAGEALTLTRVHSRGGFAQEPSRFLAALEDAGS